VRVVVAGDGPQRSALQRALPQARFLGFQQGAELAKTFASLDLFVHTGGHETFCQAAQEALASGLPVVAPAAGGLLDLVQDDVTGRLFRPHDSADLREKVLTLVADDHRRARLAGAARASVEGRGWDVIGDQLMNHYDQVLSA
jgi:phosphatidylinositol alpha 1,6-mannosyltransferase